MEGGQRCSENGLDLPLPEERQDTPMSPWAAEFQQGGEAYYIVQIYLIDCLLGGAGGSSCSNRLTVVPLGLSWSHNANRLPGTHRCQGARESGPEGGVVQVAGVSRWTFRVLCPEVEGVP